MRQVRSSAPAKVILFGEHFVVAGRPALVTAIDRRAYVTCSPRSRGILVRSGRSMVLWDRGRVVEGSSQVVNSLRPYQVMARTILEEHGGVEGVELEIMSEIPRGAGLGSSASVAVASAKALTTMLGVDNSSEAVIRYAMTCEKMIHGRPSGIDVHIAAAGGTLLYRSSSDWTSFTHNISPGILVIDSGGRRGTGKMVESVQTFVRNKPAEFQELTHVYDELLKESIEAIEASNLRRVGMCMNINQMLLRLLGVSSNSIERAINSAISAGAYGAKLTGAGGGGCVIAVGEADVMRRAAEALAKKYAGSWLAAVAVEGVRVENA
ncbi:MAG: mevalonate kinase [Nitrososphaerota archaeon]